MILDLFWDGRTLAVSKLNMPPPDVCRDGFGTVGVSDIIPTSSPCDDVFSLASDKYSDSCG